jgi:alpha-aminoadipic semialdehyde synthase
MSIDILPSEIPRDASVHFSKALKPYLGALIKSYQDRALNAEERAAISVVDGATIARNGKLLTKHAWLHDLVREHSKVTPELVSEIPAASSNHTAVSSTKQQPSEREPKGHIIPRRKRVLLLGSGMVSKPAVDLFMSRPDIELIVGMTVSRSRILLLINPSISSEQCPE